MLLTLSLMLGNFLPKKEHAPVVVPANFDFRPLKSGRFQSIQGSTQASKKDPKTPKSVGNTTVVAAGIARLSQTVNVAIGQCHSRITSQHQAPKSQTPKAKCRNAKGQTRLTKGAVLKQDWK